MPKGFARVNSIPDSPPISQEMQDAACEDFFWKIAYSLISTAADPNDDYTMWATQLQRLFERKKASFVDRGNGHSQIFDVLNFQDEEGNGICLADQPFSKANPWSNAMGIATNQNAATTSMVSRFGNIPENRQLILHAEEASRMENSESFSLKTIGSECSHASN